MTATSVWRHLFLEASRRKRMDNSVSKYTVCSPSSSTRRRNFRSRTSERIYHRFRRRGRRRVDLGSPEPPASTEPHVSHGKSSAPQRHILTLDELNDLVRDLELSKSKAELPGSRFKQWNLLEKNVRISSFRSRHQQLVHSSERKMTLCSVTM